MSMQSRASSAIAFLLLLGLWACDDGAAPPPPVSFIELDPAESVLSPGDSVMIIGLVVDANGGLRDQTLAFEVEDPNVGSVDLAGADGRSAVFRALSEGDTRILAREEGGVMGIAAVSVRTVREFTPHFGAFGGLVRVDGAGFGEDSRVHFGSVAGETRLVGSDGRFLETWIPWDAENEPIRVSLADGSEGRSGEPFVLTGGADDALEPNDVILPRVVDFPFRNPFLKSRLVNMDNFSFTLDRAGPVTIRVADREDLNVWQRRLVIQVDEVGGLNEVYGVIPVYSFGRDERQDGILSRMSLPAGRYTARVFVAPEFLAVDRRFSIDIDASTTFAEAPDAFEPNDLPPEAPEIDLPFGPVTAMVENPWGQDYYRLTVTERSRVRVLVNTAGSNKAVFFYRNEEADGNARSVHWYLLNGGRPRTWTGIITFLSPIDIRCTVDPGEYVVGLLENAGVEGPYTLQVTAEPTTSSFFNCLQPGLAPPAAAGGELLARGVPVLR